MGLAAFLFACFVRRQLLMLRMRAKFLMHALLHADDIEKQIRDDKAHKRLPKTETELHDMKVARDMKMTAKENKESERIRIDFRRRLIHAVLILGSLFYLKLSTIFLKDFRCISVPRASQFGVDETDIYLLWDDATQECLDGSHIGTTIISIFGVVCFTSSYYYTRSGFSNSDALLLTCDTPCFLTQSHFQSLWAYS